jgi:hypothetical protein
MVVDAVQWEAGAKCHGSMRSVSDGSKGLNRI